MINWVGLPQSLFPLLLGTTTTYFCYHFPTCLFIIYRGSIDQVICGENGYTEEQLWRGAMNAACSTTQGKVTDLDSVGSFLVSYMKKETNRNARKAVCHFSFSFR
ncbi:hypothetical protein F4775DRAFT_27513 [Biscogniauxia sp. FL1348]|nr:hypothetical protein F4775DRAFT_27513 [Biscogniauxia sp. FL1348]